MSTMTDYLNDAALQRQQAANARGVEQLAAHLTRNHIQSLEEMASKYDRMAASACGYDALCESLKRQLERFDPQNPLLQDKALRIKIIEAGGADYLNKFRAGKGQDWNGCKLIGRGYPIPGRP